MAAIGQVGEMEESMRCGMCVYVCGRGMSENQYELVQIIIRTKHDTHERGINRIEIRARKLHAYSQ
jgi:ferredoxin